MKFVKDERIKGYENKYMAEAFVIVMVMAFIYVVADSLKINLGFIKEYMVLILFMTGAIYISVRLTAKGMGSYSPIKGMHPISYLTIICLIASVIFGIIITINNTNKFMNGKYSLASVALFVVGFISIFMVTEFVCLITYLISKKREEKDIKGE